MDSKEIQRKVNEIAADMVARGLKTPDAQMFFKANDTPVGYLRWDEDGVPHGRSQFARGKTIEEALENANAIIEAIPPKEDRDRAEFTRLLAQVIDKGNDIGIEVDMLNPLQAMMQKLSENAITYRPKPVDDPEAPYGRDADGTPFPF